MESCDDLFQLNQANATQSALNATASEIDTYPNGREMTNTAGIKRNATTRKATVVVYPVPVDFCCASNITTPSLGWLSSSPGPAGQAAAEPSRSDTHHALIP